MIILLPPAYVVRGKVLFSQVSVCSHLWEGYPLPRSRWGGTPHPGQVPGWRAGVPPSRSHPRTGGVPLPEQHSVYLLRAGGMILAFTQEDFLVTFLTSDSISIQLGKRSEVTLHSIAVNTQRLPVEAMQAKARWGGAGRGKAHVPYNH